MGFSGDKFNFDYLLHLCTCHTESCTDSVACAAAAACCGVRRLPGQRSHWSSSSRRCFIICKSVEIDLAALQSGTTQWGLPNAIYTCCCHNNTLAHSHTHTLHPHTRVFLFRPFLARLFRGFNTGLHWLDTAVAVYWLHDFLLCRTALTTIHISSLRDWETPLPLLSRHRRRQHCVHIFIHLICYVSHTIFPFFLSFYFDTNYVNFSFHVRFSRRWQSQPVKVTCVVCLLRWQPTRTQRHRLRLCAELFRFSLCFCCVRRMSHVGVFQHCFGVYTAEQMIVIWQLFGAKTLQCW